MAKDKLKNRKNIIVLMSMIITVTIIVLSALPFSVVLYFTAVTESGEVVLIPRYYSAFAIITVGYGRFGSWLTAILSCVMFIFFSVNLFVKNEIVHNIVFGIAVFAFVDSIFPDSKIRLLIFLCNRCEMKNVAKTKPSNIDIEITKLRISSL